MYDVKVDEVVFFVFYRERVEADRFLDKVAETAGIFFVEA